MNLEPIKLYCTVHLFLIKDGKVLVEKRQNRSYCNGQYDVIAGHITGGQDVYDEMIKIAKKEVNIDIKRENLKPVQVLHHNGTGSEYIHYFFMTDKYEGVINNNQPNICEYLAWEEFKYPVNNMMEYINEAIKNYFEDPSNIFTSFGFNKKDAK